MSYLYTGEGKEETFLKSLNIISEDYVKFKKDSRNWSDCSLWFTLFKPRITYITCHKIFVRQRERNFDTLNAEIIKPRDFEDLPPKIKEALNHWRKLSWEHMNFILMTKIKTRCCSLNGRGNTIIPLLVICFS